MSCRRVISCRMASAALVDRRSRFAPPYGPKTRCAKMKRYFLFIMSIILNAKANWRTRINVVKSSSLKPITLLTAPPRIDPGFLFFGTTGATTIVQLPLAFVRSGSINLNDGKMYYVSERGYNWSRTARSSTYTYYLSLNPTDIAPSNSTYRWYGLPLRCHWPESKNKSLMLAKNFNFMLV